MKYTMRIIILDGANKLFAHGCEISFKRKLLVQSLAVASRLHKELLLNYYY